MHPDDFASLLMKAIGAHGIEITEELIDPRFQLIYDPHRPTESNGWLILFRLVSCDPSLPSFIGRWDNKDQAVDVDPDSPGCIDLGAWRGEKNGYRGHHNRRASEDPRIYYIEVHAAGAPIFKALLRLNINLGVLVQDSFNMMDEATAEVAPVDRTE